MKKNKLSIIPIVACSIGAVFVLASVAFNIPLNKNKPTQKAPRPNAFNYYDLASYDIVHIKQCSEATNLEFYTTDQIFFKSSGLHLNASRLKSHKRLYSFAEKAALIKANEPVFKQIDKAFEFECMVPKYLAPDIFSLPIKDFEPLLILKIMVLNESEKYGKAMDVCLDEIRIGNDLCKGVDLKGLLANTLVFTLEGIDLPDLIKRLDIKQSHSAINRLEKIQSRAISFKDILRIHKNSELSACRNRDSYPSLKENIALLRHNPDLFALENKLAIMHKSEMRKLESYFDTAIRYTSKPYVEFIATPLPPGGEYCFNTKLLLEARCCYEYDRLKMDGLLLQLALHAYKLEHGKYPVKLDDLLSGYLKSIPHDRFAINRGYRYRFFGGSYLLYSIGPDGVDDGGKSISKNPKGSDMNVKGDFIMCL